MASAIDATKPLNAVPADKADLRANFLAAKNEIEALQSGTLPLAGGTLTGALVLGTGASINGSGKQIAHHLLAVVTGVSGTLTVTAHSGNVVVTTGTATVTVPTTVGFHCTLIAGATHTLTFNGIATTTPLAAGDIVSLVVQSATVIHAIKVLAANKVTFP